MIKWRVQMAKSGKLTKLIRDCLDFVNRFTTQEGKKGKWEMDCFLLQAIMWFW